MDWMGQRLGSRGRLSKRMKETIARRNVRHAVGREVTKNFRTSDWLLASTTEPDCSSAEDEFFIMTAQQLAIPTARIIPRVSDIHIVRCQKRFLRCISAANNTGS